MTRRLALLAASLLPSAGPVYAGDAEDAAVQAVEKSGGSATRDDDEPPVPRRREVRRRRPFVIVQRLLRQRA